MFSFENHWKYYIPVSLSYENIPELRLLLKLTTEYWRFFSRMIRDCLFYSYGYNRLLLT